jgi:transposase
MVSSRCALHTAAHMLDITQLNHQRLDGLDADQLRQLVGQLLECSGRDAHEIGWRDAKLDKLTFEIAQFKRLQYGKKSEQLNAAQRALFDEAVDGDIAATLEQIAQLQASLPPRPTSRSKHPGALRWRPACRAWNATTSPTTPTAPAPAAAR